MFFIQLKCLYYIISINLIISVQNWLKLWVHIKQKIAEIFCKQTYYALFYTYFRPKHLRIQFCAKHLQKMF